MTQQQNNSTVDKALLLIAALFLLFWATGGCQPIHPLIGGLELSSWWGKVKVKPLPPPPEPPSTRCLIFGYSTCKFCRELHRTIRWELEPKGWTVGPSPADIEEIDIYSSDVRIGRYKHSSYPTLIIVDQKGKEVDRKTYAMKGPELIAWIQSSRK